MRDLQRYWTDPRYWRWRWAQVRSDTKLIALLTMAVLVAFGGYLSAKGLAGATTTDAAYAPPAPTSQGGASVPAAQTERGKAPNVTTAARTTAPPLAVQTVVRPVTVASPGGEHVVTETQSQTVSDGGPAATQFSAVTVQRPGRVVTNSRTETVQQFVTVTDTGSDAVTVPGPTQTVTNEVTQPGRTEIRTDTVTAPTRTVTNQVTQPARTVTGPTQTVTGPTRTVTGPTQTVTGPTRTVTSPAQTVTTQVTQPARTVTETVTTTKTVTVTVPAATVPKP